MIDVSMSSNSMNSAIGLKNSKLLLADKKVEILNEELEKVKNKGGCFSSLWNDVKIICGKGTSDKHCDEVIEAYKKGEVDFETANEKIKEYSFKQDDSLNLFSNISASVAALGITAIAAPIVTASCAALAVPFALAAIGAATGAVVKSGFKLTDRATNNIEGDALDSKQIIKDSLSGAITGSVATVTMGTASSASTISSAIVSCAKTGVKTGTVSSGGNYLLDCNFEEDKKFDAQEFALHTIEGACIGGTVGAVMGGANSFMHSTSLLNSGCNLNTLAQNAKNIGKISTDDVRANSVCTMQYKILDDRISDAVS